MLYDSVVRIRTVFPFLHFGGIWGIFADKLLEIWYIVAIYVNNSILGKFLDFNYLNFIVFCLFKLVTLFYIRLKLAISSCDRNSQ